MDSRLGNDLIGSIVGSIASISSIPESFSSLGSSISGDNYYGGESDRQLNSVLNSAPESVE